jgi:argininosuccinate lyase
MAKKLWGGRFSRKTNPLVENFSRSIHFDHRLGLWDAGGSCLHVQILKKSGYLTSQEASKLLKALQSILKNIREGSFVFDQKCEDIHTNIQNVLEKKTGRVALKLHTARSRNDQVVFATKMYCREHALCVGREISELSRSITSLANAHRGMIIPGFTHLQHAQPVKLSDYLKAYVQMLERDRDRFIRISQNITITLGAGSLVGTPIPAALYRVRFSGYIRELTVKVSPTKNSLDAVSDRDFVIESLSALSILGMHLSRLAEDMIIWSTKEFDFLEMDESYCTGSSLMPQKKNPDALELIRGNAGRLYGNLVSVLTMMKGLPLTYNRDMQLDKEPLFNSFDIVSQELEILAGFMKTLKFNKSNISDSLKDESLYATDLVYYLVNKRVPFKEAHAIVGRLVKYSGDNAIPIKEMPQGELKQFSPLIVKNEIARLFDPAVSVESKRSVQR